MITELEKEVCREYGLTKRKISDTKLLEIMELILSNCGTLELYDLSVTQDAYGLYAQIPEDRKYKEEDYDEKPAPNCGYSNSLRDTILSLLLCEQILDSMFLKDDIRYLLMTKIERLKEIIWN